MTEYDQLGEDPNSSLEVIVGFDDSPGFPIGERDRPEAPTEYDPSHDKESVPDTAYTYKERNGRFYSITHENGEEVVSELVFDIQNDEQQKAFDLALTTGQSGEFTMIELMEYNGEMVTLEITQKFIIYDTPDGHYMTVESNSRPVPEEEEKEPDENPDSDGDTDSAEPEESGGDNTEIDPGNDEAGDSEEQNRNGSPDKLRAAKAESDANAAEEARRKSDQANARQAIEDALTLGVDGQTPPAADAEPAADLGSEPPNQETSTPTPASLPEQNTEKTDNEQSEATDSDESSAPEPKLEVETSSSLSSAPNAEQQSSANTPPPESTIESNDVAHSSLELTDESKVIAAENRLPEPEIDEH